jgi:hypothetical protein
LRIDPGLRQRAPGTANSEHQQTKNALNDCMNLPDATETAAFWIRAQHRHGESNPEHFSVNTPSPNGLVGTIAPSRPSLKCRSNRLLSSFGTDWWQN